MAEPCALDSVVLSFGGFVLCPRERLLTANGAPVELRSRALDILVVLASRPNEIIGKRELLALVWPDVTVEEGSLRFHMAGLRKAIGDGKDGARFITTLAGRGYCFVAPVTRLEPARGVSAPAAIVSQRDNFLPARLARMVGREDDAGNIAASLATSRFVTVLGPGGVGKTTIAVAVAHDVLAAFDGAVLFVDFGVLSDPRMVAASVASIMGLSVQSDDPLPSLIAFLRERRVLLVLDNCEHVIEEAARVAARIFLAAPAVHILATSREALRVDGELPYRLAPLAVPPDDVALTADDTQRFPAARLFVERALAGGARLTLTDANAAIIARICRKLDGMALAIELAARRVEAYGLDQIATLLDQRFALLWPGHRTAPARQKTLQATFAWSYGLLTEPERLVFRRLAVFAGSFAMEAALAVVSDGAGDAGWVFAAIDSLVDKSMILSLPAGGGMRYRLLDTARAYALQIGADHAESAALAARHARYFKRWLTQRASDARLLLDPASRAAHLVELNNVRAALTWCFGDMGDAGLGVELAAAAAPVFFAMSLLTECQTWAQLAIAALDDATRGGRREMRLQAALGLSLMWTRGNGDATHNALNRSLALANEKGDVSIQMLLLTPLHVFHMRIGELREAMAYAEQVAALSRTEGDADATALSRILLGYSHHFAGELDAACRELEAALRRNTSAESAGDHGNRQRRPLRGDPIAAPILALAASAAPSALARTLWLLGRPAAAMDLVHQTLEDSANADHPVTLLVALMYAISVLIWNGDFDAAEEQIRRFIENAQAYDLLSHGVLGRCFQGQLAISRGDTERGVEFLQASLGALRSRRYELLTTSFNISLIEGFAAAGRFSAGLSLCDAAMASVDANGDFCYLPELLRVKADLLLGLPQPRVDLAEACLGEALALSRRQGALAWELRATLGLARHRADRAGKRQATALLQPVLQRFAAGSATADIRNAKALLASWA
jgi:predicted ATPase/DNA-binding winged helix-turn-helix (wHTH) protein